MPRRHLLLVLPLLLASCAGLRPPPAFPESPELAAAIALSPDDSTVAFTYVEGGRGEIWRVHPDGSRARPWFTPDSGAFVRPAFSPDGRRLAFVRFATPVANGTLYVADTNGTNVRVVPTGAGSVEEVVFSRDGRWLYVTKASEFRAYSPLARPGPHGMDLWRVGVDGSGLRRLTAFDAYTVNSPSVLPAEDDEPERVLVKVVDGGTHGFFAVPAHDSTAIDALGELPGFLPANDPRDGTGRYFAPVASPDGRRIAFTAPYELYVMDTDARVARRLHRQEPHLANAISPRFFHRADTLLFMQRDGPLRYRLLRIGLDGSGLAEVPLALPAPLP